MASRGDLELVPAGTAGMWEDDQPSTILVLEVAPALVVAAAASLGVAGDRVELVAQPTLRDPKLEHLAWAFEAELRAGEAASARPGPAADSLYGDSLAMAVAAHLVRQYRASGRDHRAAAGGLTPRQLRRVTEHVEAHVDQRLALAELAAVAGVSPSHFKALFKRSFGMPVHQYVIRRRVERARILLGERRATIADVAARTGFANQSHLARWIRRVVGVTPTDLLRGAR